MRRLHWTTALVCCLPAAAQQAIVNMPSADITPKGKHFLMHETQTRAFTQGNYWYGTNFYAYGLGKSTELAVTSYNVGTPIAANKSTGIGFKSSPQLFADRWPKNEIKLTVGQMAVVNHNGKGLGSFSYSHLSVRVPRSGTRLTAGGFFGTRQLLNVNAGDFLAGVEQPVGKRWILLGEWFRGRHDFGFFIPGVLFHPTKKHIIVVGFKIPNHPGNGKPGLVLEYGLTF
jgi:hypothetical protein